MQKTILGVLAGTFVLAAVMTFAQSPKAATYITAEEIQKINALPGTDRTIRVADIGGEHFSVGIIHRGRSGAPPAAANAANAAAGGPARGSAAPAPPGEPCGEQVSAPPTNGTPGGIAHDSQTEGYVIISGGGTLITGGRIVNGRRSAPDSEVTKVLNGPSCSGIMVGADVVKRVVKTGDVVIIPKGVPHGWTDIGDHVDYLSLRPSGLTLEAGYVNPAIK